MTVRRLIFLIIGLGVGGICFWADAADSVPLPAVDVPFAPRTPSLKDPSDSAWNHAVVLPPLTLSIGSAERVLPKTEVRILWNGAGLYIRFAAEDASIETPFTARDADHYRGDVGEVFLDSSGTQRVWYEFEVTPRNGILDEIYLCTALPEFDSNGILTGPIIKSNFWGFREWNCEGLRSAAWIVKGGWIAELVIPPTVLRSAGLTAFQPGTLRANFLRYDANGDSPPKHTLMNWSPVILGRPHLSPDRMGILRLKSAP